MAKTSARFRSFARDLRLRATPSERAMQRALRRIPCAFAFQVPMDRYILDFYAKSARVAIEVDGGYHTDRRQQNRDRERDRVLFALGVRTLRIPNNAVSDPVRLAMFLKRVANLCRTLSA